MGYYHTPFIRRLLPFFGYGDDEMTVYLREDRNDGEDKA